MENTEIKMWRRRRRGASDGLAGLQRILAAVELLQEATSEGCSSGSTTGWRADSLTEEGGGREE